ncbi:MAG: uridine diphosphate-N-acetylglucosamine-binding protein YvcK [Anaerolineales bacterium]|uniref:Putative gluconeogenesis factor n=1 Tax=Candidatus Desulfolinea nitratireducens TaxID=2841698 RepID=A0A8J6NIW9_9CHLR|nr:uridine diphosphate-N-acetylglucosamine-binding protein YvcK [Candidatus Desulfolinea nitratireducens]MBL6961016.1 uridine diphosphate-N-acetylglucosamine-binding protein YvcK [Anaerolineales bacterium]
MKLFQIQNWEKLRQLFRWLTPGLGVKRWLGLMLAGITLLGVGLAYLLLDIYRTAPETWWLPGLSYLALRFWPRSIRILIFGGIGVGIVAYGIWGLNRALLRPFLRPGSQVVDELSQYRRRGRGPRIVVIGGGHGLSTLLRGLKEYTRNLTAVVTVADDGGSSGKLRESMGILPPGDIRNCLAALSNDEDLLTQLFQYRFSGSDGLGGHSFGNLFISALSNITGSFEEAIAESGRVLSVHGRVLPSTLHNVRLVADMTLPHSAYEVRVEGESRIPEFEGRVRRVWLEPNDAPAFPPVIRAILAADVIVIGPGSLYTSILPNLLVADLLSAVKASRALKLFVCNIASQIGETDAYSCHDHLSALENHVGEGLIEIVIANDCQEATLPAKTDWVEIGDELSGDRRLYTADLLDRESPWRHDAQQLAQTIMDLYFERTGPME